MLPRDFSSVDRKARMQIESHGLPLHPSDERTKDFDEAIVRVDEDWAMHEATRCIHCPDPAPCQKACPAGNDISCALWLIENGLFLEAASVYRQTSSLPEVCGRICPQEKLCAGGYNAIFLGVGTTVDASLNVPGENLPGIYKATDFLVRANVDMDLLPHEMCSRPEVGEKVVVIGGGDTSSDCLRTALRSGAKEVTCLYRRSEAEMPGGYKDRMTAIEEGAKYHFLTQPVRFIAGADGHLAQIECVRTELGKPDESGRRKFKILARPIARGFSPVEMWSPAHTWW